MVCEFEPRVGLSAVRADPAWDPLSPSLSAFPQLVLSLSLSQKEIIIKKDFLFLIKKKNARSNQELEGARNGISPSLERERDPAHNLMVDFWPPAL